MTRIDRKLFAALLAAAAACGAAFPSFAQGASAPKRIASINLCTDQQLLALAAPSQIAALSPYAHDQLRSWLAERAARYPTLSGYAEDALVLSPDLVVAGSFTRRQTRDLLRAQGVRVEEFDVANSIEETKQQMTRFGALVGREDEAARQNAAIDAAVARARAAASRRPTRVLPIQRRGWVSGRKSLMTSLLETVGLRNAAAGAGVDFGRLMSLEAIVMMQPDLLLVSRADNVAEDQGSAMLLHPAIAARYPRDRLIVLPESLTVCGGPMLVEALDRLAEQIALLPSH
ncbi:MAG: iron ABC transporter [Rhizobiales bacterium 65-9]|nr:ABC transporter substrate-binding protein [Hyphomicrobiales bacterium]OJY36072.1 MAG: iron ABC transporter [Rhizobiales bacterium 65-9]